MTFFHIKTTPFKLTAHSLINATQRDFYLTRSYLANLLLISEY